MTTGKANDEPTMPGLLSFNSGGPTGSNSFFETGCLITLSSQFF